jgi:hypothetical protein
MISCHATSEKSVTLCDSGRCTVYRAAGRGRTT